MTDINYYDILSTIDWQDNSKFLININGNGAKIIGLPKPEILTATVSSLTLPDIQDTPIEQYIAEEWRFAVGRLETLQVTINFKDYSYNELYTKFLKAKMKFLRLYPDEQKINLHLYIQNLFKSKKYKRILTLKDGIINSISPPTYDNTATNSIVEFSITIKFANIQVI